MKKPNTGGAAFPSLEYKVVEGGEEIGDYASFGGMTLRDYFAAKAMQGLLAGKWKGREPETWAKDAYRISDAMIAESEKGE